MRHTQLLHQTESLRSTLFTVKDARHTESSFRETRYLWKLESSILSHGLSDVDRIGRYGIREQNAEALCGPPLPNDGKLNARTPLETPSLP